MRHDVDWGILWRAVKERVPAVRALFMLGLFASLCCFAAAVPQGGERCAMRFAVIGDRTGGHEPGIYAQIIEEIERMKPDFVLGVGDMIEGYTQDTTVVKREWREYKSLLESLTMPFYFTPGNHDIWDSTSLSLYKRYIGEPYYSFDVGDVHFVILDNSRADSVAAFAIEQIDWLRNDLARSGDASYTIVTFHIPYWIETVAAGLPDTLHSVFVEYGVDAVFTGHYHVYFSGEFDGIIYTGIGSSGGFCSPGLTGLKYHFAWVTVDDNGISIAPTKMGAVLPWEEVTAHEFRLAGEIESQAVEIEKVRVGSDLSLGETRIEVAIKNVNRDLPLKSTLEWDLPSGWTVRPQELPMEIEPLGIHVAHFTTRITGEVYPVPNLCMEYPYAEGKGFDLKVALPVERTVHAYEAEEPPVIDGMLDESIWKQPTTKLFAPDGSLMLTDAVSFHFAWDRDNLYLAAKCSESRMDSVVAAASKQDDAVYGEDCVGYFFQPLMPGGPVYQIYFNALGTAFDQRIETKNGEAVAVDREWDGTYRVKAYTGEGYWTIEAAIPLVQLEARGEQGRTWAVNFRRKQKRLNTTADWQVPIGYDPKQYGILMME
jgi:hypothetical protein